MKKAYLLLAAIVLLGSMTAQAQNRKELEAANLDFSKERYQQALARYQKLYKPESPDAYIVQQMAFIYQADNQLDKALEWYQKLESDDIANKRAINSEAVCLYADALQQAGQYQKAAEKYKICGGKVRGYRDIAQAQIQALEDIELMMAHPQPATVDTVSGLNSAQLDYSPTLAGDNELFFTSDRFGTDAKDQPKAKDLDPWTGRPYATLYHSQKQEGNWSQPEPLSDKINTSYHNGPAWYHAPDSTLWFSRTELIKYPHKVMSRQDAKDFRSNAGLFYIQKTKNGWSKPKAFEYNDLMKYSASHPALSADGSMLFFSSDISKARFTRGQGSDTDIYYSVRRSDGSWTRPKNMGKNINTSGREGFPTTDEAGNLYFSSTGHGGPGGLDIFVTSPSETGWTDPVLLSPPYNSSRDDFGMAFLPGKASGYMTSNRSGNDEIQYFARTPQPFTDFNGIVTDTGGQPVAGHQILLMQDGQPVDTLITNEVGVFSSRITNNETYKVVLSKEDYETDTVLIAVMDYELRETDWQKFRLKPLSPEKVAAIAAEKQKQKEIQDLAKTYAQQMLADNQKSTQAKPVETNLDPNRASPTLYYYFDQKFLDLHSIKTLDSLAIEMKKHPESRLLIESFTDEQGPTKYNLRLSEKRSQLVKEHLMKLGVNSRQIEAYGRGETQFVISKDEEKMGQEDHIMNRRTTFTWKTKPASNKPEASL